jgi:hypothetical protein
MSALKTINRMQRFGYRLAVVGLAAVAVVLIALVQVTRVRADIAPPEQPGGSSLSPGEGLTQVQMVSERVVIEIIGMEDFTVAEREQRAAAAEVSASFQMRNTGQSEEFMLVRFPLNNIHGWGDGSFNYPEVQDFRVWVSDEELPWVTVESPNPRGDEDPPIKWAGFEVTFPPGEDVIVEVEYKIHSTGYLPEARFTYILETGAGWQGPIGSADIILRLPYEVTEENILVDDDSEYYTSFGLELDGNEAVWHFDDLEPQQGQNWQATIFSPEFWEELTEQRLLVEEDPEDVSGLQRLGEMYLTASEAKSYWMLRPGSQHFVLEAQAVLYAALLQEPENLEVNELYLEALTAHRVNAEDIEGKEPPSMDEVINQINVVLALDPQNQAAMNMYSDFEWLLEGETVPTPGAEPTFVTAQQIEPTETLTPTEVEPTPSAAPTYTSAAPTAEAATVPAPASVTSSKSNPIVVVIACSLCLFGLFAVVAVITVVRMIWHKR